MNDKEVTDYSQVGALPGLNDQEIPGVPKSRVKSKTNVRKGIALGVVLLGFVLVVGGLLIFQKNRAATKAAPTTATAPLKKGFAEKNESVQSESIQKTKADLKKRDEEEKAAIKAVEDAQAEANRKAAAAASPPSQAGAQRPGQYAGQAAAPQGQSGPAVPEPPTPMERKMTGGVLLDGTGQRLKPDAQISEKDQQQREVQARLAALGVQRGGTASGAGSQGGTGTPGAESLAGRLQPSVLQARKAGRLPNLDYLLKRGTTVPCAMKTGIDTTLPGFVLCQVMNNVYSANGKVLLVERGATVFGEQQSSLKQGQERTFVVWTRIDNPNGEFADIDSPATDQMGYSGIAGYVDTHFWQRFGGAIMLSLIKDFSQAQAARSAGINNTGSQQQQPQTYNNTSQASQDMAAEALRSSINIPPSLVVLPSTVVNILVARDVSFEGVFGVEE